MNKLAPVPKTSIHKKSQKKTSSNNKTLTIPIIQSRFMLIPLLITRGRSNDSHAQCPMVFLVQSRLGTTRPVIRRIGCNAVDRASRFSAARGEYVEIMVNNVTVIVVVILYFGCGIVSTADRLKTKQHHMSVCHKECSLG